MRHSVYHLLSLSVILTLGNFFYQPIFAADPDCLVAAERSFFQIAALIIAWLTWKVK